jgi:hypothetical protein
VFSRSAWPAGDSLGSLEETLDALEAHQLQCRLFGREIVIEARLPYAENVGNILSCGAMESALGKDMGGGLDNLRGTPALAQCSPGRGQSVDIHANRSLAERGATASARRGCPGGPLSCATAAI